MWEGASRIIARSLGVKNVPELDPYTRLGRGLPRKGGASDPLLVA